MTMDLELKISLHVCLLQVNEETGNRRPVMLTVQRVPRMPKPSKAGNVTDTEREEGEQRAKTEETQTDTGKDTVYLLSTG